MHKARKLLSRVLRLVASSAQVKRPFYTREDPRYAKYEIGAWTYGAPIIWDWNDGGGLQIGRFCSLAAGVTIVLGGDHRYDWVTTYPFSVVFDEARHFVGHPRSKGPVIIGNDVWIGHSATILSGVTVHDGAVIGAGSVVSKDVGPYSIVAGNPARHIKDRFTPEQIYSLLEIRWWDWSIEKIQEAWPLLLGRNIDSFTAKYKTSPVPNTPSLPQQSMNDLTQVSSKCQ